MKIIKLAALAAVGVIGVSVAGLSKTVKIDAKKSQVEWTGSKIIGSSHHGFLNVQSGELTIDKSGKLTDGKIIVDMKSMRVNQQKDKGLAGKDNEKKRGKLIGHLKSDDFFSVKAHPEALLHKLTFKNSSKNLYQVDGTLEIKGIPGKVSFPLKKGPGNTLTADLEFDRTKYNVRYGSDKFFDNLGDKVISDKIQLSVKIALPASAPKLAH